MKNGLTVSEIGLDTGLIVIAHALLSAKFKGMYEGETTPANIRAGVFSGRDTKEAKKRA